MNHMITICGITHEITIPALKTGYIYCYVRVRVK